MNLFQYKKLKKINLTHFCFSPSVTEIEVMKIYEKNEEKCRKNTKTMGFYIFVNQSTYITASLYSVYCMFSGNWDTTTWPLPFHFAVPFNENTILGWYLVCIAQFSVSLCYALSLISVSSYFFCSCNYIAAICDHFSSLLHSIAAMFEPEQETNGFENVQKLSCNTRRERKHSLYAKNESKLLKAKKQLKHAIQLHLEVFE